MPRIPWLVSSLLIVISLICPLQAFSQEPVAPAAHADAPVSVAVARDRAALLHRVYANTLDVMHERYFHGDRATVPARALEDVFAEVARESKVKARWISVNTKPMSINHEPKTDFEKRAAAELSEGKESVELTEKGYYWRAAPIPLTDGCISCHTGFFNGAPKSPRYAGLIIGMPVEK